MSDPERHSNRRRSIFSRITDTIASFIPSIFESRQTESSRQLEAEHEPVRPAKRPRTSESSVNVESSQNNRLSVSRVGTVNLPSVTLTLPMNIEVDLDAKEDGSDLSVSTSGVSSLLPRSSRTGQFLVQPSPVDYRTDYISQRNNTTITKRQNTELWTESASKRMRQDDQQSSTSHQSSFISPFYHGRVSYGGAASVRPANQKRGIFDNVTPMKFIIEDEADEKPKSQPAFLSNAAQSILQSLERHSSSITSNDRIPLPRSNPFSALSTPLTRNTVRHQPYLSTYNRYKQFKRQNTSQSVCSHAENGTETGDNSNTVTSSVASKIFTFNASNSTQLPIPSTSHASLPDHSASQPAPSASSSRPVSTNIDTDNRKYPTFDFRHPVPSNTSDKLSAIDSQSTPLISYATSNSNVESANTIMNNQKLQTFDFSAKTSQSVPSNSFEKLPSANSQTISSKSNSQVSLFNGDVESTKADKDNQKYPNFDFSSKTSPFNPLTSHANLPGASILKSSKESTESSQRPSTETAGVRFASKPQFMEKSTSNNGSNPVFVFSDPICIEKPEVNLLEIQPELSDKPVFTFSKPEYAFKKAAPVEQSTFLPTLIFPVKTANAPTPEKKIALPEDLWRCESCMMENSDRDSVCRSCHMPSLTPRTAPKQQPTNVEKTTPPSSSKWECPTCLVKNKAEEAKCVCCQTVNPNDSKNGKAVPTFNFGSAPSNSSTESSSQLTANSNGSNTFKSVSTFNFGSALSKSSAESNFQLWECPSCMVKNKAESLKCVCCQTANPNGSKEDKSAPTFNFGSALSKSSSESNSQQWECPTCLVKNKAEVVKCVCCQTANPNGSKDGKAAPAFNFGPLLSKSSIEANTKGLQNAPAFTFGSVTSKSSAKANSKEGQSGFTFGLGAIPSKSSQQWGCPTCMVSNKGEAVKCVCCQTTKPNDSTGRSPALLFDSPSSKN